MSISLKRYVEINGLCGDQVRAVLDRETTGAKRFAAAKGTDIAEIGGSFGINPSDIKDFAYAMIAESQRLETALLT